MPDYNHTPWFDVRRDGPPVRKGVYEGTASGVPGETGTLQHGFYYWDGVRWSGWATTPSSVRIGASAVFQPQIWRGIVPNQDYPEEQMDPAVLPASYAGTLEREGGHDDKLLVERFHEASDTITLRFSRARGARPPEVYACALSVQEGEYRTSTRARIVGFTAPRDTQIRLTSRSVSQDGLKLSFAVNSGDGWHVFSGTLAEFPAREAHGNPVR